MLYYALFSDIESAKTLYLKVKEEGIKSTLAPAPKLSDSHCCGISILYYDANDTEKIKELAKDENILVYRYIEKEKDFNPERNKFL